MSELDRLHAEVLRDPAADEPRTAYADAVAKRDPDRAELIRVQMQLRDSRRKGEPPLARSQGYQREEAVLKKHGNAWSRDVATIPGVTWVGFRRGFPEHVEMTARDFLAHGDQLYARAPILHVDLLGAKAVASALSQSPLLARLHSINLSRNGLGDDEVKALAASPYLGELRWLDLSFNSIGPAGVDALAASTMLPSLRYVTLAENPAPDPTPQIGESDVQAPGTSDVAIPEAARALEARFGKRRWLSYDGPGAFPPERDQF